MKCPFCDGSGASTPLAEEAIEEREAIAMLIPLGLETGGVLEGVRKLRAFWDKHHPYDKAALQAVSEKDVPS